MTVDVLRSRLAKMEDERRFDGDAYPLGMCRFPFQLVGQGFFPGGDGLWRDDGELACSSTGVLPVGGSVFLGNDFGTIATYRALQAKGYENPPTWRNLKQRIRRAGLPEREVFMTNATVGLRSGVLDKALEERTWEKNHAFVAFCREFLTFQVKTTQPRLIVVLGPGARSTLMPLLGSLTGDGVEPSRAIIEGHATIIHFTSHPYGDFNFTEERKAADAARLRIAWQESRRLRT
jgi:hypothetical protein